MIVAQQYRSNDELIGLLRQRNLSIANDNRAFHYLELIGYHRLRAYCQPFYRQPKEEKIFRENTSFNDIIKLYVLDRELRLFLMGPIEKIEVGLRALIIEILGNAAKRNAAGNPKIELLDTTFYNLTNENNVLSYQQAARACVAAILQERRRSKDVRRLLADVLDGATQSAWSELNPYDEHKLKKVQSVVNSLSAWHVIHRLPFGPLSKLFSILRGDLAQQITEPFNLSALVLRSMLFSLTRVRNFCAHHQPIWFQRIQQISFPKEYRRLIYPIMDGDARNELSKQGVYMTCATIHILLSRISETTTWYARLKPIIDRFDERARVWMGFPRDWDELPFWSNSDVRRLI